MDLRHLQTLVVLAEELHFGRAARRLFVVQSAVTRTLQDLEGEIGTLLFRRSKRRVELTPAGEALVQRAREILRAADQAAEECRRVGAGKRGRLRIALAGASGLGYLPEPLRRFRARHPEVDVELVRMGSAAQIAALQEGRLDVGLTSVPPDDEGVVAEPLVVERLLALLPETHALAREPTIHAAQSLREPVAILSRATDPEIYRALMALARSQGVSVPRVVEVDDISFMMTLVAAGLAVSHLPEGMLRLAYRGVVAVPVEPAYMITLFATRRSGDVSPLVESLLFELGPGSGGSPGGDAARRRPARASRPR